MNSTTIHPQRSWFTIRAQTIRDRRLSALVLVFGLACLGNSDAYSEDQVASPFARGEKLPGDLSDLLKISGAAKPKARPDNRPLVAAIPTASAQAEPLRRIEAIFKRPVTADEKLAMAKKLIAIGTDEKNPTTRYVLYRYAGKLAIEAKDPTVALNAVDHLRVHYEFDALAMKAAVLEDVLTTKTAKAVLDIALQQYDRSVASDNYSVASRFGKIAYAAARRLKKTQPIKNLRQKAKRLDDLKKALDAIRPSIAKLKANPDDRAANLKVGEYFCLIKNDWQTGIPLLAKGGHPMAKMEVVRSLNADSKKKIGDGWWALAESASGDTKNVFRQRAQHWYQQALPQLTGLAKAETEKRLAVDQPAKKSAERPPANAAAKLLKKDWNVLQWTGGLWRVVPLATLRHEFKDDSLGVYNNLGRVSLVAYRKVFVKDFEIKGELMGKDLRMTFMDQAGKDICVVFFLPKMEKWTQFVLRRKDGRITLTVAGVSLPVKLNNGAKHDLGGYFAIFVEKGDKFALRKFNVQEQDAK